MVIGRPNVIVMHLTKYFFVICNQCDERSRFKNIRLLSIMIRIQKRKHVKSLDGVRGLAVILVLITHCTYGKFLGGWIGVDVFFVLSGYLITSLLQFEYQKTEDLSFKNFYIRRVLRLYPALILCVILANILWSFSGPSAFSQGDRMIANLSSIFYFNNIINGTANANLAHLWSLSVEEHFYFIWPLLMYFFFLRLPVKKIFFNLSIIILLVWFFRIYVYNHNPTPIEFYHNRLKIDAYQFTFCKIDSILLGAMISFFYFKKEDDKFIPNKGGIKHFLFGLLILLLILISLTIDEKGALMKHGIFVLTNIVCVSLIIFALNYHDYFLLSNNFMCWFGTRSYGIYLYHFPVFLLLEKLRINHNTPNLLMVTALRLGISLVLAEISYRFMETPILRLKEKFNSN